MLYYVARVPMVILQYYHITDTGVFSKNIYVILGFCCPILALIVIEPKIGGAPLPNLSPLIYSNAAFALRLHYYFSF